MAALVSACATVAVAVLSASRLSNAPVRGRLPGPDPVGSAASLAALAVGLAAFIWLGRSLARDTPTARPAVAAGVAGGALTGLCGGGAQAIALADYLGAVLAGYAVPPELLIVVLAIYVGVATAGGAAVGGTISYLAWRHARPRSPTG